VQTQDLLAMLGAIRHRGPDAFGVYRDGTIGLGNARLSIIDLSGGDQPIGSEDGSLWIVFNGEIFNYVELRPELERRGHRFSTNSDTEVILHLYEEYGPDCLRFLNGQFALAIWNETDRSLFVARDRVGVRPFFYTVNAGRFIFASEIKSLLTIPEVHAQIDPERLREVFMYWSTLPPATIFSEIYQLPPGHYALIRPGQEFQAVRYWDPWILPQSTPASTEALLDEFERLLIDATRIRMRADVPVGAYLSGGLDSSTTTALIRTYTSNRLDTFSISFDDPLFDESSAQRQMAAALGTRHHTVQATYRRITECFPEVIWHAETPILRTAPAPMYLLSKLVRQNDFKVVLTGEGADEFLAGYDLFKEMKIRRFWASDPQSEVRSRLLFRLYPDINRLSASGAFLVGFFRKGLEQTDSPYYSHQVRWSNTSRTWRFLADAETPHTELLPPLPDGFSNWPALSQAQYLEITTFLSPYLLSSQGDRMAMAHSVEGRYPFLDVRVMEFCNRLPLQLKMPVLTEKWLLKRLAQKYVPEPIWQKVKRPYRAPVHRSFFDPAPLDYVSELLSEEALQKSGYFDPIAANRLAQKAASGANLSEVEDMALVGILSTQLVDHFFIQQAAHNHHQPAPELVRKIDHLSTSSM
jgi:asparagine synthase (glutamine-hydrolysing)